MKYEFKCKACETTRTIECPMSEITRHTEICGCGLPLVRVFKANTIVPDGMKAANVAELSNLNSSFSTLPSGKRKAIY